MTDTQRKAILLSLMGGASRVKACHAAGLPSSTFYDWLKKNKAFKEAVEEAEAEPVGTVEGACYRCAMRAVEDPRYFRFMAFYLERKAGWVKPAAPAPAHEHAENTGKTMRNVQSTPASVGAQHAAPTGNPHKSVQNVQLPAAVTPPLREVAAGRRALESPTEHAGNTGKTVRNVQTSGDGAPASNKPANLPTCEPATSGKTVQNVQTTPAPVRAHHAVPAENPYKTVQNVQTSGDGASVSMAPAPVRAQRAALVENPRKTVRNVQPARSSVAFKPADAPSVIPNLKAKIRETMDANRARR